VSGEAVADEPAQVPEPTTLAVFLMSLVGLDAARSHRGPGVPRYRTRCTMLMGEQGEVDVVSMSGTGRYSEVHKAAWKRRLENARTGHRNLIKGAEPAGIQPC